MIGNDRRANTTGRKPWREMLPISAVVLGMLTACASQVPSPHPSFADGYSPGVRGSIVPVPTATPTSFASLGRFGAFAQRLDAEYHLTPDFVEWNTIADQNCAAVGDGKPDVMFSPAAFVNLPADSTTDKGGNLSHPVTGRAWGASLVTRCPQLITSALRAVLQEDQSGGLAWAMKQG